MKSAVILILSLSLSCLAYISRVWGTPTLFLTHRMHFALCQANYFSRSRTFKFYHIFDRYISCSQDISTRGKKTNKKIKTYYKSHPADGARSLDLTHFKIFKNKIDKAPPFSFLLTYSLSIQLLWLPSDRLLALVNRLLQPALLF